MKMSQAMCVFLNEEILGVIYKQKDLTYSNKKVG